MDFDYINYNKHGMKYPNRFGAYSAMSAEKFSLLQKDYDEDGLLVDRALKQLKKRTTQDYYRKVYRAQTCALTFSKQVFPTYKFIMPEALADDWLSTVDWHKKFPTRDHSLHQTLTAYIVSRLLGNGDPNYSFMLPNGERLLDFCARQMLEEEKMKYWKAYVLSLGADYRKLTDAMQEQWAKDVFYETAVVSALFHDMGYPWQYINRLAKHISIAEYGVSMNMIDNARLTKDAIRNRLLIYPFYGYSEINMKHASPSYENKIIQIIEQGLRESHGLPGALGFMCLNDQIRRYSRTPKFSEASYRLILDWAAVGIMMHDMADLYWGNGKKTKPENPMLRLAFDVDPLSSIISMADILEEFHRPFASFASGGNDNVEISYSFPCKGTQIYVSGEMLHIVYYYEKPEDAAACKPRRLQEVHEYFNHRNGFVDLEPLGIKDVVAETKFG